MSLFTGIYSYNYNSSLLMTPTLFIVLFITHTFCISLDNPSEVCECVKLQIPGWDVIY